MPYLMFVFQWSKMDPVIPSLPNLKRLELVIDEYENFALLHLASFIKESPCMHTLVLRVCILNSVLCMCTS